jgi:carboxymethylenebutenolidase
MPLPIRHALLSLFGTLFMMAMSACGGSRDRTHVEAMAREHAGDSPVANASRMAPAQDITAREVVYGAVNGRELTGYLARPIRATGDSIPALVVIHEWWGLNENVRMMARRLAGEGYAVLAVDLYGGKSAATPQEAQQLMMAAMNAPADATANLEAAAGYLRGQGNAPRVGILGWCFGGGWSLRGALAMGEGIDAAVMYYGQPITDAAELSKLRAPLLGHFGEADQAIPVAQVREMEAKLHELGKDAAFHYYAGAGHAFANPSGTTYEEAAAEQAWERTRAFLAAHLKAPAQ